MCFEKMKTYIYFTNDIGRWHTVSNEWSHHCNFALACADYVCRCLPMNISVLKKPMVCDTDYFCNHKKGNS